MSAAISRRSVISQSPNGGVIGISLATRTVPRGAAGGLKPCCGLWSSSCSCCGHSGWAFKVAGGLIHILLVIALVLFLVQIDLGP